jgi:hypothetical protein
MRVIEDEEKQSDAVLFSCLRLEKRQRVSEGQQMPGMPLEATGLERLRAHITLPKGSKLTVRSCKTAEQTASTWRLRPRCTGGERDLHYTV